MRSIVPLLCLLAFLCVAAVSVAILLGTTDATGRAAPPARRENRPPGRGRAPTRPRGTRHGKQRGAATGQPRPGEIWWADVPYEDGTGSKIRPCLVLHSDGGVAHVLKITSQDKSWRRDHIAIPTADWDPKAQHDSFLDLSHPIRVSRVRFTKRAGRCDPGVWLWVQFVHRATP